MQPRYLFIITKNKKSRNKFTENLIKPSMISDVLCEMFVAENHKKSQLIHLPDH